MGKAVQVVFVVMLTTCLVLMSAQLELTAKNSTDLTVKYAQLFSTGVVTLAANSSCKCAGVFAINCTSYLVCAAVNGGFVGAQASCPPQENFNPITKTCSSSYVCQSCTEPGFFCPTISSFTLCAAAGVEVINNQTCPSGYYCNKKCASPCLDYIPSC